MIKKSSCIFLVLICVQAASAFAAEPLLEVSPGKCVTLKQGSQCYQDIEVNWQTDTPGSYCLNLSTGDSPLQCWTDKQKGYYEFEFVGHESAQLRLIEQSSGKLLKESLIEVKWVYRNRSRYLSWRVF